MAETAPVFLPFLGNRNDQDVQDAQARHRRPWRDAGAVRHGGCPRPGPSYINNELQTVTVTAQRRTENIKEVPVSVSAIKGEKLEVIGTGGQDIRQLAFTVPSLNIESSNGRTFPRFYIRGYGNTDFTLVRLAAGLARV